MSSVNVPSPKVSARLLPLLRVGEVVSGTALAESLGVSRVAVWKAVQDLKGRGVRIDASREGYLLVERADLIDPSGLISLLRGCVVGRSIVYRDSLGSTQTLARTLADESLEDGIVILAESQTAGRGRLGRPWVSDRGGLWFSVALTPRASPDFIQVFSYMASLSVRDSIEPLAGAKPWLKWPNDVFVRTKKVSGVLTEVAATVDEIRYVILGIGVNVNNDVSSIDGGSYDVTSLKELSGAMVDRGELLIAILRGIDARYAKSRQGRFADIIEEYRGGCATIGERVRVSYSDTVLEGKATGIDERGALEVESGGRTVKVHSGDVIHLRTPIGLDW
jgi:BirA family biotin operon repressor/biotin-[acetyl-CoA-carboxylase] ligase